MEHQYFCWCVEDFIRVYRIHYYTGNVQFYGTNKWLTSCHTSVSFSNIRPPTPISITEAKARLLCQTLAVSYASEVWLSSSFDNG